MGLTISAWESDEATSREWKQRAEGKLPNGEPMPKRDVGDPSQSPEIRILRAWLDAIHADSLWATLEQFESAWLAIQAELARRSRNLGTIADLYLPADVDPQLRQLFALPSNQAQAVLLGYRDEQGLYHPGWADFSEAEYRAMDLWLTPVEERDEQGQVVLRTRETWEVARDMAPARARRSFGRRAWLEEETVERYLREARRKLRLLFGVENPHNGAGEVCLDSGG